MKSTQFDYLLNALELASQEKYPAKAGYAGKRQALFAYVRDLERQAAAPSQQPAGWVLGPIADGKVITAIKPSAGGATPVYAGPARVGPQAVAWRYSLKGEPNLGWVLSEKKPHPHVYQFYDVEALAPIVPPPDRPPVDVSAFRQGNWEHPDHKGRILGWIIPNEAVERMGADAFCLPREVEDALTRLAAAHGVNAPGEGQR